MTIEFEDLVDDGASYPCSFIFTGYGEAHQCKAEASCAITVGSFESLQLPKTIKLYSRAICTTHKGTIITFGV